MSVLKTFELKWIQKKGNAKSTPHAIDAVATRTNVILIMKEQERREISTLGVGHIIETAPAPPVAEFVEAPSWQGLVPRVRRV